MSPAIWTQCGGRRSCTDYAGDPWRVVEGQHLVSTRELVDSDEEQQLLEELLEGVKPPLPPDDARGLHYLLFTPFRHPPLRWGSRFGTRFERSLWYGSEELPTALAEVAFYRFVLLEHAPALGVNRPLVLELSAFRASVRSAAAVDLTSGEFARYEAELASATSYESTQALGAAMRADGVELVRYRSARDPAGGPNVALFSPRAFAKKKPTVPQTWHCVATRSAVEFSRKDYFVRASHRFEREAFEIDGRLPVPA